MAWAAFASASAAPSRLPPFGRKPQEPAGAPSPRGSGARRSRRGSRGAPGSAAPARAPLRQPACPCRSSLQSRGRLWAAWRAASRPRAPQCQDGCNGPRLPPTMHVSSQAPSQDCREPFHALRRRCTRSEKSALPFLGKDGPCPSSVASRLAKSRCAISSHAPFQSRTMPSPQAAQQDSQERAAATLLTGVLPRISVRASLEMPPKSVAVIASVKNAATSSLPSSKDCLSSAR